MESSGCLAGIVVTILVGIVITITETYDINPLLSIFLVILGAIILIIIGIYVASKVSQRNFDNKDNKCKDIKAKYPKAFIDFCKKNHINISHSLDERDMDRILKESEAYWNSQEKLLIEEERKKHIDYVNNRYTSDILSQPRRKKYVSRYLEVNLLPENFDIHLKEKAISNTKVLDEYITNHLKEEYNRIKKLYPDGLDYFQVQNDDVDFGDKLENEEFYDSCVDSEQFFST